MSINQPNLIGEGGISPEPTGIEKHCNTIIYWILIFIAFIYPLFANPFTSPAFVMPKLTLLRILTVLILSLWLVKIIERGRLELISSHLNLPLLIFFLVALVSTITSIHRLTALFGEYSRWEGLLTLLAYGVICLATLNFIKEKKQYNALLLSLFLAAPLISILAILEYFKINLFFLIPKTYHGVGYEEARLFQGRVFATFGNPLSLGGYLSLLLPLGVALFLRGWRNNSWKWFKWLLPISLPLMTLALLYTYGRAAWLGTVVALIFIVIFSFGQIWHKKWTLLFFLGLLILSFSITFLFGGKHTPYTIFQRATSIFRLEGSALPRLEMWRSTLPLIADRPILGWGPDTYKLAFPKYKPASWVVSFQNPLVDKAHNELLQIAATLGLLGLFAYLWLLGALFWQGASYLRRSKNEYDKTLMVGLLAGALAFLIQIQFNFSHLTVAPLFWLTIGLAFGLSRREESKPSLMLNFGQWFRQVKVRQIVYSLLALFALLSITGSSILFVADTHFAKASDYQSRQLKDKAMEELEQATRLNPFEELYFSSLGKAYLDKALVPIDKDDFVPLTRLAFARAQEINPLDENVYFGTGNAYLNLGIAYKDEYLKAEAIAAYKKGLKINPTSADAWFYLAEAYGSQKKMDQAVKFWEKAIALNPRQLKAYLYLGLFYRVEGLNEKAIKYFKEAIVIDPSQINAYVFLGMSYEEKGLIDEAKAVYQKAVHLDPKHPNSLYAQQALRRLEKRK